MRLLKGPGLCDTIDMTYSDGARCLCRPFWYLRDPVFSPPSRPVRQYYQNTDGTVTMDRATVGTKSVAVMDDLNYAINTGEYSRKISRYETQLEVWGENDAKGYALVL